MTADEIKALLGLTPLTVEGGYFAETYRSGDLVSPEQFGGRYESRRTVATAIYYLLEPGTFSEMHRVKSDEIFHFYLGDPVEMLQLWPDGSSRVVTLGTDLESGMRPQVVVPRGVWQGCRLRQGGTVALLGCTVSPGFEYADYESGQCEDLAARWPDQKQRIAGLTR